MLSFDAGHDVGYLTSAVAGGREGYYTGAVSAGEPAGRWHGRGAERLGLRGEVDADLMAAIYHRVEDPRTVGAHLGAPHRHFQSAEALYESALAANPTAGPEQRAKMRADAGRAAKQAVAFYDMTFSAPKSVTVLAVAAERAENDARAAGDERAARAWAAHREAVEAAVMAGARASIDYLEDVAGYSRVGHNGRRAIDAHQFTVAQFLQHDSRDRDPQLHVHQAILNRVQTADGKWRTLNGQALVRSKHAAGALAERVMEAHLAGTLGVRFVDRADGLGREVAGVDARVMELFSSRRQAITGRGAELEAAFEARFGRPASPLERRTIYQQATLETRQAKSHHGEDTGARLDRWERETREVLAGGLAEVARTVLTGRESLAGEEWEEQAVIDRALDTVGDAKQAWNRSNLMMAVANALPANLGLEPAQVRELLDRLTDKALGEATPLSPDTGPVPAELRLENGRSSLVPPGSELYATPGQLASDQRLRDAAITRVEARCSAEGAAAAIERLAAAGVHLGADQAAALTGIVSSGAQVQVLSAPAGSGKSFVVGQAAATWAHHGGRVLGLAPSQIAADVLREEGVEALNLARWRGQVERGQAPAADLLVLDEAGMARTDDVLAVVEHAERTGATVVLVGDPRQLAAVGPGGALSDLAGRAQTHELVEVRRFSEEWEKAASLRLRDGDRDVLDDYDRHGRIVDGGTPEEAERKAGRAWLADTVAGRESVLVVGSNDAAARLSGQLREQLVALGRVAEGGVELGRDGNVAGVGDLVQARRNDWTLSAAPVNRATYRVLEVLADGGLRVAPAAGGDEGVLPASYVAADLTLAYASTVHAAQGRTVDTAHAVLGPGQDAAAAISWPPGRRWRWSWPRPGRGCRARRRPWRPCCSCTGSRTRR